MSELAYKFTRLGHRSPLTGFVWPAREWVSAEGDVELCANGIHGCRLGALPRWIDEELWRIEVEDLRDEFDGVLVAKRGRLVSRINGWNREASLELARSCASAADRLAGETADPLIRRMADEIGAIAEGPDPSATALAMYCTAHAFDVAVEGGYIAERKRQSEWLRDRLGLEPS